MSLKGYGLTARDGVMLHLLEKDNFRTEHVCPESVTQPGIARTLLTKRSYISYVLARMEKEKQVDCRLSHVKGANRKRKVYFLSRSGKVTADQLAAIIGRTDLELIYRGEHLESTFGDISAITGLPLSKLAVRSEPGELLDMDRIPSDIVNKDLDLPRVYRPPVPDPFVGREEEFRIICRWFSSGSPILQITGFPGIGKTSLVAKALNFCDLEPSKWIFLSVRSWGGEATLFTDLARLMDVIGRSSVENLNREKGSVGLDGYHQALEMEVKKDPFVLIIDDVHHLLKEDPDGKVIKMFADLSRIGLKLAVISREPISEVLSGYDGGDIMHIRVHGLEREESRQLLGSGVSESSDRVLDVTMGHPLFVKMVESHGGDVSLIDMGSDIRTFMRREMMGSLNRTERDTIDLLSMARSPVSRERLFDMDTGELMISEAGLSSLRGSGMVVGDDLSLSVHQMIKDTVRDLMNGKRKRYLNSVFADHFRERIDTGMGDNVDSAVIVEDVREHLYHLWRCGSLSERAYALAYLGEELITRALTEDLKYYSGRLLDEIERSREAEGLDPSINVLLLIFNGWCLSVEGDWEEAMKRYTNALEISLTIQDPDLLGRCRNAIGTIHLRTGDLDEALDHIKRALSTLSDRRTLCKARSNMAVVLWMKGQLDEAITEVDRSLDLAMFLNDPMGVARALINRGIIQAQKGDLEGSRSSYEKAMDICDRENFIHTLSIVHDNIGEVLREMGDYSSSLHHFRESLHFAERLGFKWQIAEGRRNVASLLDERPERQDLYNSSLNLFRSLGDIKEVIRHRLRL